MRILVIDSFPLFRESLVRLLEDEAGIVVVGDGDTCAQAVNLALTHSPDVILMDSELSDGNGIDVMKTILASLPSTSFVILSSVISGEMLIEAVYNGARGILPKTISKPMLITSLRALERGEVVFPRKTMTRIVDELVRSGRLASYKGKDLDVLTFREMDVLRLLGVMATNREIATQLTISENTVRVHVSNILEKLHVRNRREAAFVAREMGIVE